MMWLIAGVLVFNLALVLTTANPAHKSWLGAIHLLGLAVATVAGVMSMLRLMAPGALGEGAPLAVGTVAAAVTIGILVARRKASRREAESRRSP